MLIHEIADIIEQHAPISSGMEGDELGLLAGDPQAEVTGVITCWSPTLEVLERAAALGANVVLSHEPLTWGICGRDPEAGLKWYDERHPTAKVPNQLRMKAVLDHALAVYRYHSNWDWAPEYGQVDMLVKLLELGSYYGGCRTAPVYEREPISVGELARQACEKLGIGPIRIVGDPERIVSRISVTHGGFGQIFTVPEVAADAGAELALFGEMLDYTIRYCVEIDLAAIELGHCASEQPGMEGMAQYLRERIPADIPVECIYSGEPWAYIE
jgi:putative NIF3 family GTP cyclohydrolase 1 type 2